MSVTMLDQENMANVSLLRKVVGFQKEGMIYFLATGQKNGSMFVPMKHGMDYKYKGKSGQASVKAAVQNGERVVVCENVRDFFIHFK